MSDQNEKKEQKNVRQWMIQHCRVVCYHSKSNNSNREKKREETHVDIQSNYTMKRKGTHHST